MLYQNAQILSKQVEKFSTSNINNVFGDNRVKVKVNPGVFSPNHHRQLTLNNSRNFANTTMDNYKDKDRSKSKLDHIDIPTVKVGFPSKKAGKKSSMMSSVQVTDIGTGFNTTKTSPSRKTTNEAAIKFKNEMRVREL